jgi:hypothetical protein
MRTAETFKENNHEHRRFFGGVASTLDLSASRRRAEEKDGEDGLPVPPSKARPGAEGDRVAIGNVAMRDFLSDLRVVTSFFVVPPLVGLVVALTTLPNPYAFWPVLCVATIVAGFATLLLAVPTFLIQEQRGRTGLGIYLRNGALLGCLVSGAVEVPLFDQLLAHVLAGGHIDEITEAILSVAAYCAFLGIVGAATFWLVARPDHPYWRGCSRQRVSHGPDDREIGLTKPKPIPNPKPTTNTDQAPVNAPAENVRDRTGESASSAHDGQSRMADINRR